MRTRPTWIHEQTFGHQRYLFNQNATRALTRCVQSSCAIYSLQCVEYMLSRDSILKCVETNVANKEKSKSMKLFGASVMGSSKQTWL